MTNSDLANYIQQSRASGISDEQITSDLLSQGWSQTQIADALIQKKKSKFFISVVAVLFLAVVVGGGFVFFRNKSSNNSTDQSNTQLYVYENGDFKYSFRYPKGYCEFEEGGSNIKIAPEAVCNNPENKQYLSISLLPSVDKTTEDFIKILEPNFTDTGKRKTIGGFTAFQLKSSLNETNDMWVFLIDNSTAMLINSQLTDVLGGQAAEDMVLNSFAFGKDAESYPKNAIPKAENFNPVGARAIGFIGRLDISPNDQEIIFSYSHDGSVVNLYTANIDGINVKIIEPKNKPARYFPIQPRYSHDGTKILFVSRDQSLYGPKGIAYIMNRDGSNLHAITKDNENVLEAVFSGDDKNIFYLRGNVYKNYNGMAPDLPHEINAYEVAISGGTPIQITNRNAYEVRGLSLSPDGSVLQVRNEVWSLGQNPPTVFDSMAYEDGLYQFYPKEKSMLWIDYKNHSWYKVGLPSGAGEWKAFSLQEIYPISPVFFHGKNTVLFFKAEGAFPQTLFSFNLDEPLVQTGPLPDEDPRVKEIPIAIPQN